MKRLYIYCLAALFTLGLHSCKTKEEKLQDAEEEGNFMVQKSSRLIEGMGDALKDDGKNAAESISEGAGEVVKGITSGFDKSFSKVSVELDAALDELIDLGRAGKTTEKDENDLYTVSVYIIPEKPLKGVLVLKAFDKEGIELGRSKYNVDVAKDDAQYHDFKLDDRVPMLQVHHFSMNLETN